MNTNNDQRIILTLDAGGTNFVFSAIRGNRELVEPIRKPSYSDNLERLLAMMSEGFTEVKQKLDGEPAAISFAFPGPADYVQGVIGVLPNFKAFRGGVPLGPYLEDQFGIPVFINNDGNLFAYGEALAGFLPELNRKLADAGSIRQFDTLIGLTLGTGFGSGIVVSNQMLLGNNTGGAEVHNTLNALHPQWNAEESVSTRAIQRVYSETSGEIIPGLMPADIADIAKGKKKGFREAAVVAFREYGRGLGASIANVMSLIDGLVVLGGGITAAWDLFAPAMFGEIDKHYESPFGEGFPRLSYKVYNLEDPTVFNEFALGRQKELTVPGSGRKISYDEMARSAVGLSRLGASRAIALGAYAYALQQLDNQQ
ncbi:MAG: ROK family protein [Bacteroidota bacterium]